MCYTYNTRTVIHLKRNAMEEFGQNYYKNFLKTIDFMCVIAYNKHNQRNL